jgi:hypothetical protein
MGSGFSSDISKPAMAESTLVKGTDMVYLKLMEDEKMGEREERERSGEERGNRAGDQG